MPPSVRVFVLLQQTTQQLLQERMARHASTVAPKLDILHVCMNCHGQGHVAIRTPEDAGMVMQSIALDLTCQVPEASVYSDLQVVQRNMNSFAIVCA